MAGGSRKFVSYTDGRGETWALLHDESNWEAVNGDTHDVSDINILSHIYQLPGNVIPRYARFRSTSTTKVREVAIATNALYLAYLNGQGERSFTENGETFVLVGVNPEIFRPLVFAADTGLQDGDDT